MTEKEIRILLSEAFKTHMFMSGRDYHTVNELLYIMRSDSRLKDFNFNITVLKLDGSCCCIPSIDTFVNIDTLAVWFYDDAVEYDCEAIEFDGNNSTWDCLTVYETKQNN